VIDDDLDKALSAQLQRLDEAHARAKTPTRRRKLEAAERRVRKEYDDIRAKGQAVDLAYVRWAKKLEAVLAEFDYPDRPGQLDALAELDQSDVAGP